MAAAYVLRIQITNPMTGGVREIVRQFDPTTITQAKWSALGTPVQGMVTDLLAESTAGTTEPPSL